MAYSTTKEINSGCSAGFVGFSIAFTIGIILSLTGIGAILGVPLIIAGIIYLIKAGSTPVLVGKCPYCGHEVQAFKNEPGVTCEACNQRIIIKNSIFYTLK